MEMSLPIKDFLSSVPPKLQGFVSSMCFDLQLAVVDDTFISLVSQLVKQQDSSHKARSEPLYETFCRAVSFLLIMEYDLQQDLGQILDCLAFIYSTNSASQRRSARVFEDLWLSYDDGVLNWTLDNSLDNPSNAIKTSCMWLLSNHFTIQQGLMDATPLTQVAAIYRNHEDKMLSAAAKSLLRAVHDACDHRSEPQVSESLEKALTPAADPAKLKATTSSLADQEKQNPKPLNALDRPPLRTQPLRSSSEPLTFDPISSQEMLNITQVSLAEIKQQPAYGFPILKKPKLRVSSDQELKSLLVQSFKGKETDENWSKRSDLIYLLREKLRTLSRTGSNDDLTLYVQDIIGYVCIAANSLRSTYAISALQFVIEIYLTLPFCCEWLLPIVRREIYPLCLLNKKLVANFASYVIGVAIMNSSYSAKLLQFSETVLGSANTQSHAYGPQWIAWVLAAHSQHVLSNIDLVAELTETALKDSSNETRHAARRVFWMLSWYDKQLALGIIQRLNTAHRNALIASKKSLSL